MLRRSQPSGAKKEKHPQQKFATAGIILFVIIGILLVPVSLIPALARSASGALSDMGIASSRTSLSSFDGSLQSGLPAGSTVGVQGAAGVFGLPNVIQADPVALDLIGYGPVQLTAPTLEAVTNKKTSLGSLADGSTLSTSRLVNPVIRALYSKRPSSNEVARATAPATSGTELGTSGISSQTTAYIATSQAPTLSMFMTCPNGTSAVDGGGSDPSIGAHIVASTATDATGIALSTNAAGRGWTISFSVAGYVTLWLICGP